WGYPRPGAARVMRILNQVPRFVVYSRVVAKTDVPSLAGVTELDTATGIDRPILCVNRKPSLALEVQPQFLPDVLPDTAAWGRNPNPWQESTSGSWIPVLPIGDCRNDACADGKQERQGEKCHDAAMGQWHRRRFSSGGRNKTEPDIEEIGSRCKPQRDEGEADGDTRERQIECVGFRDWGNEPFSRSNQSESRHHEYDSDEQCLDGRRHSVRRVVSLLLRRRRWRRARAAWRLRWADGPLSKHLILAHDDLRIKLIDNLL